jgi:hypothetical protein
MIVSSTTRTVAGGGIGVGAGATLPLGSYVGYAPVLGACPSGRFDRHGTSRILRCRATVNC